MVKAPPGKPPGKIITGRAAGKEMAQMEREAARPSRKISRLPPIPPSRVKHGK
jgi:hypothetical protein